MLFLKVAQCLFFFFSKTQAVVKKVAHVPIKDVSNNDIDKKLLLSNKIKPNGNKA